VARGPLRSMAFTLICLKCMQSAFERLRGPGDNIAPSPGRNLSKQRSCTLNIIVNTVAVPRWTCVGHAQIDFLTALVRQFVLSVPLVVELVRIRNLRVYCDSFLWHVLARSSSSIPPMLILPTSRFIWLSGRSIQISICN
jgi:hypothetical protein